MKADWHKGKFLQYSQSSNTLQTTARRDAANCQYLAAITQWPTCQGTRNSLALGSSIMFAPA